MRHSWFIYAALPVLLAACSDKGRDDAIGDGLGPGNDGGNDGGDTGGPGDDGGGDDGDGGVKFDIGEGGDGSNGGDNEMGCEKVDFLFVIDNSGSMEDEQQNLVNSFPGFISTIQDTLMAQDYHIMVTDTDAESLSFSNISCTNGVCSCMPAPQCCLGLCFGGNIAPPPTACGGIPCSEFELPTGCNVTLGAGKTEDTAQNDCGIAGGRRYMVDGQPDLAGTFECVAKVGAGGDGNEKPMEAMMEAVTTLNVGGECNEGFLRNDAILVVTFITDEEDDGKSAGNPMVWKDTLVQAKNNDESAIVVLGLIGDTDVPGGVCAAGGDADASPILRSFAESFSRGQWGSVCAADYTPFFLDAVSEIDSACDDFVPPG